MFPSAGAGGAPSAAEKPDDGKMLDLGVKISASECYARNESKSFPMSNLFIGDSRLGCKSDADEQIILHVAFNEFVKVGSCCAQQRVINAELCLVKVTLFTTKYFVSRLFL